MIDKQLMELLGSDKKYIFRAVGWMLVGSCCNIGVTACLCFCIHLAIGGAAGSAYGYPLLIALGCILLRFLSTVRAGVLKDTLGRNVKKSLRAKLYAKLLVLGTGSTGSIKPAGLTQLATEGIEQMDLYYSSYLPQFFYAMLTPVILFIICVSINWKVAVVLLLCVPLIPVSIVAVSKFAKKIFAKYWGKYTSMGDVFLDSVQGLKDLKIYRADERQHAYMNESAEEFRKITMKVLVMQLASVTIMDLVAYGGAGLGITFALMGAAGGENIAQALFLILIAAEFFLPLRAFGSAFHVAMNGASAGRTMMELLKAEEPVWGEKIPEQTELALQDVSFSYDGQRQALQHVSMKFADKGMTALVGESGCGKTTVAKLITGIIRAGEGKVLLGGTELAQYDRAAYYGRLAYVSFENHLFHDTVRENFLLANPDATDEEMRQALKQVRLLSLIEEKGGLDAVVSEDAENFSGGQKQRLALAVNLTKKKAIYLFDEATGNIDTESEDIIMEVIRELSRSACVIVISHRLANVVKADRIYFMVSGEVKETGTHEELMKADKGYAALFRTQKELEEGYLTLAKTGTRNAEAGKPAGADKKSAVNEEMTDTDVTGKEEQA